MEETPNSTPVPPPLANPMAIVSLVLGVASAILLTLLTPLFFLTGLSAVVFGHLATRKIRRTLVPMRGRSMARSGLVLGYLGIVAAFVVPLFGRECEKGTITKGISNCRQVITTLRLYSSDNGGNYPDADPSKPSNSNDVFRLMFVGGQADNEMIFGCPLSPYQPDGNIGKAPDFREALKPGENHWAMTRGLNDSASGTYPLVYENPTDATWPPKWDANAVSVPKRGRVWANRKIIIGMNDSSVALQSLETDKKGLVGVKPLVTGGTADLFSQNDPAKDGLKIGILNVAR